MAFVYKGKHDLKKRTIFRHSTTFYRKLKVLKANGAIDSTLKQHFSVVKPSAFIEENNSCVKEFFPLTEDERKSINRNDNNSQIVDERNTYNLDDVTEDDISDSYDNEEPKNSIITQISLSEHLRTWYHSHRITHSSLDHLLRILKSNGLNLPTDSRTLLKTPRTVNIETMGNGEFWYNGIENCLNTVFYDIDSSLTLPLVFNVDGIPPFNSSPVEFWPILFRVENMPFLKPMVIAIYCGETKPPLKEFLGTFVKELNNLLRTGCRINGHNIKIVIKYFVCDTPARSFIKGTVGFNAAHGCIKCTVIGEFDKKGRHMSFPRVDSPLRTDDNFRKKSDLDHHKDNSPLLDLPIDMVEDVIIADSLHLFDLGIMRKCLYGWANGSYNFRTKWSATQIDLLSDMLEDCNIRRPIEIHRAIRRLKCLKFWKGTEYRTFLLYLGPVVLKDFLCAEAYHNFLTLFCAVTIISCKSYLKYINVADCLFKDYIEQFIEIYGIDSISSNVHNAAHVVNDVKKFGNLSEINAYPFENFLGHLKSLVRTGNRPLAQIAKRVNEMAVFNTFTNSFLVPNKTPFIKNENRSEKHQLLHCDRIFNNVFLSDNFMLSNDIKNKWFMTKNNDIVSMINATYFKGQIHIYGSAIKIKSDFFELPVKSSYLNIYKSDGRTILPKLFSLNEIKCKLVSLKYKEEFVFLPLLHTLDIEINT